MELKLSRETLRFERLIAAQEEQVGVEGEATLPGSMRDAVTVLNVQAQAHLESVQAGEGGMIAARAGLFSDPVYAGRFDTHPDDGDNLRF